MKSTAMAFTVVVLLVGMLTTTATNLDQVLSNSEAVQYVKQCAVTLKESIQEDRSTVEMNSSELYSTWFSQECEVRAGPEYIIRRYTFFKNSTFLLVRFHYDDMSCSLPTHTVSILGSIKLLGSSNVVLGATDAKIHVDAVYITPLNPQVAHKFEQRMNSTCGPQPKWRPYVSQLIYEQPRQHPVTKLHGPVYNSVHVHSPSSKRLGQNCLDAFKIGVGELKLLRVQRRIFIPRTFGGPFKQGSRLELLLGSPAPNVSVRKTYKATSLQSTLLIHFNMTKECLICSSISRSTELNPPLLHVTVPLPALIGGYWLSERCESVEGGIWSRRRFRIYSGDKLWIGRWEYYDDPKCSLSLYAVTAAGSYIQRDGRQHRLEVIDKETVIPNYFHSLNDSARSFKRRATDPRRNNLMSSDEESSTRTDIHTETSRTQDKTMKKNISKRFDSIYQLFHDVQSNPDQSRFMEMLQGRRKPVTTLKKPAVWDVPSGDTELDLHIAVSKLIPGDAAMANRCDADWATDMPLTNWPRNCVPQIIEAPSTLRLRAKMEISWNGQNILILGVRSDNVWHPPLRQCAQIPLHSPILKSHLRRTVDLRFGLLSAAPASRVSVGLLVSQLLLCCLLHRAR